jgi:hypothetical protein
VSGDERSVPHRLVWSIGAVCVRKTFRRGKGRREREKNDGGYRNRTSDKYDVGVGRASQPRVSCGAVCGAVGWKNQGLLRTRDSGAQLSATLMSHNTLGEAGLERPSQ